MENNTENSQVAQTPEVSSAPAPSEASTTEASETPKTVISITAEELKQLEEELAADAEAGGVMLAPPVSDDDKNKFEAMLRADNTCMIAGWYQDKPASIISFYSREADGSVLIYPVAVMVTPEMATQLKDDIGRPLPVL